MYILYKSTQPQSSKTLLFYRACPIWNAFSLLKCSATLQGFWQTFPMNFSAEIMTQREQPGDRQLPRSDICLTLQTSSGRKRVPPRKTRDSRFRARSAGRSHSMRRCGLELQGELGFLPCLEYVRKKNVKNKHPLLYFSVVFFLGVTVSLLTISRVITK